MSSQVGREEWTIARAKERFSEVIRDAGRAPQRIFRRDRLVAFVVDAESYEEFLRWKADRARRSIGQAFAELREILKEERYQLDLSGREDRRNDFTDDR